MRIHPDACVANVGPSWEELGNPYGPYRCTCPGPCPACDREKPVEPQEHTLRQALPTTLTCSICGVAFVPNLGHAGALAKGQHTYCSAPCRKEAENRLRHERLFAWFIECSIATLTCAWCSAVHRIETIDHRRLGRYVAHNGQADFYCHDNGGYCYSKAKWQRERRQRKERECLASSPR